MSGKRVNRSFALIASAGVGGLMVANLLPAPTVVTKLVSVVVAILIAWVANRRSSG